MQRNVIWYKVYRCIYMYIEKKEKEMIILGKREEKKQKQQAGFSFVEPPNPGFGGASCLLKFLFAMRGR